MKKAVEYVFAMLFLIGFCACFGTIAAWQEGSIGFVRCVAQTGVLAALTHVCGRIGKVWWD